MEKYTNKIIPDESTLRKRYVFQCYQETIDKSKTYIELQKIWIMMYETTNVEWCYAANVVVGTLELGGPGKHFLINTKILKKANHSTISKLFDKSLQIIWPNGIKYNNVLLLLSEAALYMVKTKKAIQVFYSKMIHITCLARGLHRVGEKIRKHFPKVDQLISNGKKNVLKAPSRVHIFKEITLNILFPPSL